MLVNKKLCGALLAVSVTFGCASMEDMNVSSTLDDAIDVMSAATMVVGAAATIMGVGSPSVAIPTRTNPYRGNPAPAASTHYGSQPNNCAAFRVRRDECRNRWQSIGGGNSGQAGSFQQCMNLYQSEMNKIAGCY